MSSGPPFQPPVGVITSGHHVWISITSPHTPSPSSEDQCETDTFLHPLLQLLYWMETCSLPCCSLKELSCEGDVLLGQQPYFLFQTRSKGRGQRVRRELNMSPHHVLKSGSLYRQRKLMHYSPSSSSVYGGSPGKNIGVGCQATLPADLS